ncbi:MAG: hypothetical protein NVSMB32_01560 [Actinomycetota bacterium]
MEENVRERGVLPLFVPLGIFALMGLLVFSFSRILLNVPRQVAVAVALMTALNVLVTCYVISVRKVEGFTALLLVAVIAVPVVLGAGAASKIIEVKVAEKAKEVAPVQFSAKGTAFSSDTLNLPAGTATIVFKNLDTAPHNIHIFGGPDAKSPSLFAGSIVTAGQSATYSVPGLKPGSYFFRCDVHPAQMVGMAVVSAGSGSGSSTEAGGSGAVTTGPIFLGASNTAFNKKDITVAAGAPITVNFHNGDSAPHNFDIVSGPAGYQKPATPPKIIQAGESIVYNIPGLPAGTYQFQCDVHAAQMKGTLTVK